MGAMVNARFVFRCLASRQATKDKTLMKGPTVVLAITLTSAVAGANVEIGGTGGMHAFSKENELGVSDLPGATSLKNAPMFGLRLGIYFGAIGIEAEGDAIPTQPRAESSAKVYTGVGLGNLVIQLRAGTYENTLVPFILLGGGVLNVVK